MNREILFRGKRTDNKGGIEGLLTIMWGQYHIIKPSDENTAYPIDPETVCQYTGLTDKNGRKIFEGDICKDSENIVRILWNDKHQWGVEILKTDNVLSRGLIFPLWQYDNCKENGYRTLEVIGNIFDNPELFMTKLIFNGAKQHKSVSDPLKMNQSGSRHKTIHEAAGVYLMKGKSLWGKKIRFSEKTQYRIIWQIN